MEIEFKKLDADSRDWYNLNLKRSLVATLVFFNLLIYFSPRLDVELAGPKLPQVIINVENIPRTRQVHRKPPPPKPTVPVPSEDETIPEDVTIEETTLKYTNIFADTPEGVPPAGVAVTPPKPIAWVFPEYPEDEKKKGVSGEVKLSIHIDERGKVIEVVVLENTTGSEKCAKAAIEAAYGSRFFPAKEGNRPVSFWISQPYRFDLRK